MKKGILRLVTMRPVRQFVCVNVFGFSALCAWSGVQGTGWAAPESAQGVTAVQDRLSHETLRSLGFWETEYTWNDAALLAAYWQTDIADAKAIASAKVEAGYESLVGTILYDIVSGREVINYDGLTYEPGVPVDADVIESVRFYAESLGSYYNQESFGYCDAEVLSKYYKEKIRESKALLGRKVIWGLENEWLNNIIPAARIEVQDELSDFCRSGGSGGPIDFYQTEYTTADAYILAALWNITVVDSKALIADKVAAGLSGNVGTAIYEGVSSAEGVSFAGVEFSEGNPIDADTVEWASSYVQGLGSYYRGTDFSYCDAEVLSLYYKEKIRESKALLGTKALIGLTDVYRNEVLPAARVEVEDQLSDFCKAQ